jgi:hypothetical protein
MPKSLPGGPLQRNPSEPRLPGGEPPKLVAAMKRNHLHWTVNQELSYDIHSAWEEIEVNRVSFVSAVRRRSRSPDLRRQVG